MVVIPPMRAALLPLLVLAVGCSRRGTPAVIGLSYDPISRNVAAARLAAADLARSGEQRPIELALDSSLVGDTPDLDVRRAERFVARPEVLAVVGPSNSRGALAAAPVYNAAGLAQLSPQATSRLLGEVDGRTFTMVPNDSIEGAFLGRFIAEQLAPKVITIYFVNDEYGIGLRDGVEAALRRHHLPVADRVPFSTGGDFDVLVRTSMRRARADLVVVAGRVAAAGAILTAAHALNPDVRVVAGDGALVPERLMQIPDTALRSLYLVSLWQPDPRDSATLEFRRRFRALIGREAEPADAYVYDAIMTAAAAIRAAGTGRSAVASWLASLGGSRPAYRGITGPVSFGSRAAAHMSIVQVRDGHPVPVGSR